MVVCFVAILCPILAYFLIAALIELRKILLRKQLFDVRLGNCLTPRVLIVIFCRFTGFTKMQLTLLLKMQLT